MDSHCQLLAALTSIRYTEGVLPCPGEYCAIRGQSFFPGGKGHVTDDLPIGGIMFLGHNFDKIKGFENSRCRGREENLTWRSIRSEVLTHLPEEKIWFTNYLMGVLDRDTNIGAVEKTAGFPNYEEDCWNFFKLQVALQHPTLIVALGKEIVRLLSAANRLDIPTWAIGKNCAYKPLRHIEHKRTIRHQGSPVEMSLVAAYHPSYGRGNAKLKMIAEDSRFIASLFEARATRVPSLIA